MVGSRLHLEVLANLSARQEFIKFGNQRMSIACFCMTIAADPNTGLEPTSQ